jgi:cellulose synthase/poly-beta-1,6-N-acetylglucosamine synthase-like glycosyltransferase
MTLPSSYPQGIALIVFAHNEELIIQETTRAAIRALRSSQDALFVIADNCDDETATLAGKSGAQVFMRDQIAPRGKGAALTWFLEQNDAGLSGFDYLVVLDADSQIQPDFIENLAASLSGDILAAQCYLNPIVIEEKPLGLLIGLSELIEQNSFERIRSMLGLSVRLRGTGMVFKTELLCAISKLVDSEVEDIVLNLLIAEKKVVVRSLRSVVVNDPKPGEIGAASRQRARWFRGQWDVLLRHQRKILKLICYGPKGWSLLSLLFLKPRWLKLCLMLVIGLILITHPIPALIVLGLVLLEIMMWGIGFFRIRDKHKYLQAMLYLPGFIWMWVKGIVLSFKPSPWQRVRK